MTELLTSGASSSDEPLEDGMWSGCSSHDETLDDGERLVQLAAFAGDLPWRRRSRDGTVRDPRAL